MALLFNGFTCVGMKQGWQGRLFEENAIQGSMFVTWIPLAGQQGTTIGRTFNERRVA